MSSVGKIPVTVVLHAASLADQTLTLSGESLVFYSATDCSG